MSSSPPLWRIFVFAALLLLFGLGLPPLLERQALRGLAQLSSSQGLSLESASLQFSWGEGFHAQELSLSHEFGSKKRRFLEIDEAFLQFDWQNFFAGEPQLRNLRVTDASLSLLAEDVPVELEHLSGTLQVDQGWIHLLDIQAQYQGLHIFLQGKLPRLESENSTEPLGRLQRYLSKQGLILARAEGLMQYLELDPECALLRVNIQPATHLTQGKENELQIEGSLDCANLLVKWPQQEEEFDSLQAQFSWDGVRLEIANLELSKGQEKLLAQLRFDSRESQWQADLQSNLNLDLAVDYLQGLSPSAPQVSLWPAGDLRWQAQANWKDQASSLAFDQTAQTWFAHLGLQGRLQGSDLQWQGADGELLRADEMQMQFAWNGRELQFAQLRLEDGEFLWQGAANWSESQWSLDLQGQAPPSALFHWAGESLELSALSEVSTQLGSAWGQESLARVEAWFHGDGQKAEDWQLDAEFFLPQSSIEDLALDFLAPLSFSVSGSLDNLRVEGKN